MDEQSYLELIRSSPGDEKLLREYALWLAANDDPRGEYLESELAFRATLARLQRIRSQMYELTIVGGLDLNWLDSVHPLTVTAIMTGTFYSAPSPDQPAFVKQGDPCESNTIVGIIETMSIGNQIVAGTVGYVSEIIARDGQSVSRGDTLIKLVRVSP
jgi:biotin carboxyl carrier protein